MKKIIAMLLALVMVLGLAACASKTEPAQTEEPAATETTPLQKKPPKKPPKNPLRRRKSPPRPKRPAPSTT